MYDDADSSFMLTGGARKKNKEGGDEEAAGMMLLLGDTIRASTPGLPMLDGLELVVIRLDRTTTGAGSSITLLVTDKRDPTRYGYRQELTAAQFAANFQEDIELLERATERGFARQNGLVPGKWMRMTFQDGTSVRGEIVDLVEDMITVRSLEQPQQDEFDDEKDPQNASLMYIDFAYRGVPPEIVTLALIEPPFRPSATAASTTFAPEPLEQLQQLVDEAERQMERENNLATAAQYGDDAGGDGGQEEEQQAIFGAEDDADFAAAIASSSSSLAGGFDTYTIAVQVDVLVTAMLSRYTDAQRTTALLLRVQRAVQRYCYTRRTGMAHEGERALHWIVPPPCPATALTEQQVPIGMDTYGQRGRSTRAQPIPTMPRWLLPVVAAQSSLCVMPGELENATRTAPPDVAPLSLALEVIDRDRNVKELERSDNTDSRRSGRVHAELLRLWRDPIFPLLPPPPPTGGGEGGATPLIVGTAPEIRSRGGVHAVVSNFDLVDFEHTSGAWDEDMRLARPAKKKKASKKKQGKKDDATQQQQQKKAPRRKQQQQPNGAFDSEAEEASAPSSGAETEDVNSDDESVDRVFRRRRSTSAAATTPGSIDFGSSSEEEEEVSVVAGGDGGDDYEPDEAAPSDNDERMDEQEQEEEGNEEDGNGTSSSVPVTFMRRQTSELVRLMPPLVAVVARQLTGRDHPDFSTLPAPERGYSLMSGDAAAVRSVLCVPPTAASSARSSLFERIAAAEVAVPSSEYVAYMRGRPVTDVTQQSWWRQQQKKKKKKKNTTRTTALVHATLNLDDPTVAALDDSARLEMLVERTAPSGTDLLSVAAAAAGGGRLTSLDRVMHALAPACAALRGPGDAALMRQVLTRAQRAARQWKDRRARQMRVITDARYADELQKDVADTSAAEALVAALVSSSPLRRQQKQQQQQQQEKAVELLGHLQAEYLPAGRRGAFNSSSSTPSRLLPGTASSEQLLGWLRQDGGAALSALVAHATAHLEPNVPLLLERGARPQPQGDQCGPRVLAKTYPSTADMLADAAPVFDADLDPVDYALARRLKEAHAKEMKGRRADGLYDYILGDIERTQAYGPGVDYPRFARSMVVGKHAVVPGNYAVVREGDLEPAFYVRRQAEQGGPAVWVRDPEVQSDAAFMTTEAMLCEIRSLRAPGKQPLGPDAFCLASSSSDAAAATAKQPKQCLSGLALVEQKRTSLLDEIARRQRAVHRVSQQMWLARARHRGKRVVPPTGMQHMITSDRAMRVRAGRSGGVVVMRYNKNGEEAQQDAAAAATDNGDDPSPPRAEDSPHFLLWRRIDGGEHELGPEARFEAIAAFARAVCRDPISGTNESQHWLVCKDSGAPLVPIVLRDLAAAFLAGHGSYTALLARLLNEAEDAGESYVHGPTGTILCPVESATEYHFDEEGMAVADRTQEMRETRAARGVAQQLAGGAAAAAAAAATTADLAAESELAALARTGDGPMLHRYVLLMTHHLGAGTGPRLRRAALQMALDIAAHPRIVPTKKAYELSVAKLLQQQKQQQQQKQKAPLEYDALVRQRKIGAAAAAVLVAVQTSATAAAAVARDVFRGCIASFSGFPLDPDARQREAIEYVACVLSAVSRDDDGARGLFATAKETAHLIERAILGVALADIPSVQRALNDKRLLLQQQQQRQSLASAPPPPPPTRDDEAFFVPPLRPTPPAMLGSSTGSVRMRRLAMALVHALRHQLSRQQLLLLTRKAQLPILSNACCETRRVSALLDYAQRDPEVRQILREMFAAAAASPSAISAACGAALRALPRHRAARRSSNATTTTTLVTKLGTLNRARVGALSNAAAAEVFKRLPIDQASLTAPSLMAQMHGAKGKGPPVDRDGRPMDAAALELLQKVADDTDPQNTLIDIFRQTLLPPRRLAAAPSSSSAVFAAILDSSSSSSSSSADTAAAAQPRAAASMRRMMAMVAAADKFEARTAATEGQAIRDLRDALQSTLVAQLGMLQAFLKAFCPAREPPIALSAADYGNAPTISRYTDYASLMRLGGAWFARTVLTEMSGRRQQQQQQGAAGQPLFFFQDRVASVMRTALENGNAGGAGLSAETGAAQMFDYYSDLANAWACVYARRIQHEDKDAILVPKPHKHWGLDPDDFDLLYSRTDLPFQRFTAAPGVVACAAMAGVSAAAESRAMWTAATDLYLREFRTSGDAFRRRATGWIPSVVTTAAAAAATSVAVELAQMGCLCTLLHACLLFADASGAPGDNSVTGLPPSHRQRMGQMAQYLSRLTITLRTGEQPSRTEPAATSYIQIAERIAFSNDREKESLKQKFRALAKDPLAARIERQLKKLGFGQYGIDAKRLNRYGERNRQGFISHDLNEPSTNAYDAARQEPREQQQQQDEDGEGGDDEAYDDGDEEMEDFADIDEYGREHDD